MSPNWTENIVCLIMYFIFVYVYVCVYEISKFSANLFSSSKCKKTNGFDIILIFCQIYFSRRIDVAHESIGGGLRKLSVSLLGAHPLTLPVGELKDGG